MTVPLFPGDPPDVDPFDVVVISFNNVDLTTRAVISVLYTEPSARVILVDNGSSKPFKELRGLLKSRGHEYIRLPNNLGPYGAANAGIERVRTERFVLMCNDCAALPGTLRALVGAVSDEHPYVCASEVQSAWFDPAFHRPAVTEASTSVLESGVFFTCFAVQKKFVDEVGPFDPDFKLTFGDTDWEQRASDILVARKIPVPREGHLFQAPNVRVFHGASVTRKRLGIDRDLEVDLADHRTFHEKWASRPDVMRKHPMENFEFKKAWLEREWANTRGEQ